MIIFYNRNSGILLETNDGATFRQISILVSGDGDDMGILN